MYGLNKEKKKRKMGKKGKKRGKEARGPRGNQKRRNGVACKLRPSWKKQQAMQ